jgi:hypothetical protein
MFRVYASNKFLQATLLLYLYFFHIDLQGWTYAVHITKDQCREDDDFLSLA